MSVLQMLLTGYSTSQPKTETLRGYVHEYEAARQVYQSIQYDGASQRINDR